MRPNVQYGESNLETIEFLPDKVRIPFQEGRTVQMRNVATRQVTQRDLKGSFLKPSMTIPSLEAHFQLNTVERGEELERIRVRGHEKGIDRGTQDEDHLCEHTSRG